MTLSQRLVRPGGHVTVHLQGPPMSTQEDQVGLYRAREQDSNRYITVR